MNITNPKVTRIIAPKDPPTAAAIRVVDVGRVADARGAEVPVELAVAVVSNAVVITDVRPSASVAVTASDVHIVVIEGSFVHCTKPVPDGPASTVGVGPSSDAVTPGPVVGEDPRAGASKDAFHSKFTVSNT